MEHVSDPDDAMAAWLHTSTLGIEGIVAKRGAGPYLSGKRCWVKVKRRQTLDAVVGGCRAGNRLLLGLYDDNGLLHHVGETVPLRGSEARTVMAYLRSGPRSVWTGRPPGVGQWEQDRYEEWIDCRPQLVVEVSYSQTDHHRFRHPVRLVRLRQDREPESCRVEQLDLGYSRSSGLAQAS